MASYYDNMSSKLSNNLRKIEKEPKKKHRSYYHNPKSGDFKLDYGSEPQRILNANVGRNFDTVLSELTKKFTNQSGKEILEILSHYCIIQKVEKTNGLVCIVNVDYCYNYTVAATVKDYSRITALAVCKGNNNSARINFLGFYIDNQNRIQKSRVMSKEYILKSLGLKAELSFDAVKVLTIDKQYNLVVYSYQDNYFVANYTFTDQNNSKTYIYPSYHFGVNGFKHIKTHVEICLSKYVDKPFGLIYKIVNEKQISEDKAKEFVKNNPRLDVSLYDFI